MKRIESEEQYQAALKGLVELVPKIILNPVDVKKLMRIYDVTAEAIETYRHEEYMAWKQQQQPPQEIDLDLL